MVTGCYSRVMWGNLGLNQRLKGSTPVLHRSRLSTLGRFLMAPYRMLALYRLGKPLPTPVGAFPLLQPRTPGKSIIWYDDFWYQAHSWDVHRRLAAKVERHQAGLFP